MELEVICQHLHENPAAPSHSMCLRRCCDACYAIGYLTAEPFRTRTITTGEVIGEILPHSRIGEPGTRGFARVTHQEPALL